MNKKLIQNLYISRSFAVNSSHLSQNKKSCRTPQYISDNLSLKRVILNFIKGAAKKKFENIQLDNYKLLLNFLKEFDKNIYFSTQSFTNYKQPNQGKFELYMLNHETLKFIEFVKETYPHFKEG